MTVLNKHQILAATDYRLKRVTVLEWGGDVFLKTLNVDEGIRYQAGRTGMADEKASLYFLIFTLCDEEGKAMFTQDDIDDLAKKDPHVLGRLALAALEHNKMLESSDEVREGE